MQQNKSKKKLYYQHLKITGLSHEGRGISYINGKTVFIHNALPNEIVDIEILQKNSRFLTADAVNINTPSSFRVEPKCPHVDICAGCQLQHMDYKDQLEFKKQTVLDQLSHIGKINISKLAVIAPIISDYPWQYRHKARLSVKYVEKKQKLLIGFHEKNGRYIADISSCDILPAKIGQNIELLKSLLLSLSPELYKNIPQIEIACDADHYVLIIRHLINIPETDLKTLKYFEQMYNYQIYLQPNKPEKLIKLNFSESSQKTIYLSYKINNILYQFFPTDFTQINPAINIEMVNQAIELFDLQPDDQVLDLFCGLGNFSLAMAEKVKFITGIEGDVQMVERARENAKLNHLTNTAFYTADLFEPDIHMPVFQQSYSKILIDPPRTGAIEILPIIAKISPKKILYISCNPATLARDINLLVNHYHYDLKLLGLIDMFPHTKHIESMVLLEKSK